MMNKKQSSVFFWQSLCVSALLAGCHVFSGPDSSGETGGDVFFSAASWNLEALFDANDDGTEYADYSAASGWNREKYKARLTAIAHGVEEMAERSPDFIAFEEVENAAVLSALMEEHLKDKAYRYSYFARNPGAPLGLGAISKFPFLRTVTHSVSCGDEASPRPMLELWMDIEEENVVFFVCHWKSKLGGGDKTENLRRSSARILSRRIKEIEAKSPETLVLVMGDLNENHDEFYRQSGLYLSALLPDDPKAAEFFEREKTSFRAGKTDSIVLSHKKPPAADYFGHTAVTLYSPWTVELEGGSYFYRNAWETIDHFLVSRAWFDKKGWEYDSASVCGGSPFANAEGKPLAYNPRTGSGLSDHLPLIFYALKRKE